MKIRIASITDASNIADIHATSWRETYKKALTENYLAAVVPQERKEVWVQRLNSPQPNQYIIVAECGEDIVGFACFYAGGNPDWGSYLENLHVRKAHQSNGIGKKLLIKGAHWCSQQEPNKGLCLLVNQDNIKAQYFYKDLGAQHVTDSVWNAPDGSVVPTYWLVWNDFNKLITT